MIRRGFRKDINEKIDIIEKICKEYGFEFDNSIPNHYRIIYQYNDYVFTTYNDIISALDLLKGVI